MFARVRHTWAGPWGGRRYRVRWRRLLATVLALLGLSALAWHGPRALAGVRGRDAATPCASGGALQPAAAAVAVRVRPGDTLWDIARRHAGAEGDVRALVELIMRENGLATALIRPGMVLEVPAARR